MCVIRPQRYVTLSQPMLLNRPLMILFNRCIRGTSETKPMKPLFPLILTLLFVPACRRRTPHKVRRPKPCRLSRSISAHGAAAQRPWSRNWARLNLRVLVQAYSFTNVQIAKALVDAHKRGVKVEGVETGTQLVSEPLQPLRQPHQPHRPGRQHHDLDVQFAKPNDRADGFAGQQLLCV